MSSQGETFESTVQAHGLQLAMRWINTLVPYRFTAIFAFDHDMLRTICLVDKQDTGVTTCPDQPISDSYCLYVQRSAAPFSVEQSLLDPRVAGHPKQRGYQCYYGIPLLDSTGNLLGTVCHFDTGPIPVTGDVVTTLDDLAPLIARAAFPYLLPNH